MEALATFNCEISQNFIHRFRSGTNAVRHADSTISVTRERQSRHSAEKFSYALHPRAMPHVILRHGFLPFVNSDEKGLRADSENLLEFAANDNLDFIFGILQDTLVARASQETTNQ